MKERLRAEELAQGLAADSSEAKLTSLRAIKNLVIGNKREKTKHLLYLPTILHILSVDNDPTVLVQAAQSIGSFASAPDSAKAVVEQGGVPKLLKTLRNTDIRVVEAAIKALKLLYRGSEIPASQVLDTPGALSTLVSLLSADSFSIGESAAAVLARCCNSSEAQNALIEAGAARPLIFALQNTAQRSRQTAALAALAALTKDNSTSCIAVLQDFTVIPQMLDLVKSGPTSRVKFTACVCLTHLSPYFPPTTTLPPQSTSVEDASAAEASTTPAPSLYRDSVENTVLPVLVRLMKEPEVAEEVPPVLIALVKGKLSLQAAAVDADAINYLADLLKDQNGTKATELGRYYALMALGMLTENVEVHRRLVVDSGALPLIASALTDPSPMIRGAACCCMRSLSRSTRLLRFSLGSLGDIAAPLLELSRSEDITIATEAAATLANMAVEYSSLKEQLLVLQGITRFAELAGAMDHRMRLYGIWGLSSVVYLASAEVKSAVMKALPWSSVVSLLKGEDGDIKEKTLLLLRNLVHRGVTPPPSNNALVMEWSQGELLSKVLESIEEALRQGGAEHAKHIEHALYAVVNIASGGPSDKDTIMEAGWGPIVATCLEHPTANVREAAVWAIINMTWSLDNDAEAVQKRRAELRNLGVERMLRDRAADTSVSVRERAATALEQLLGRRADFDEEAGMLVRAGGGSEGDEGDEMSEDQELEDEEEEALGLIDEDDEEHGNPEGIIDVEFAWREFSP